ncbi:unnamed protein product [Auanema sp. JU1783]|nr:unnamed protein product [Auanema sp. JU1783]
MAHNYLVSAKKATVVTDAVVGNFTSKNDLNLILAKVGRVHIHKVTAEGLKSVQEVSVYGRIVGLSLFRPKGEEKDCILVLTAKYHLAVLGWDEASNCIVTRAAGSVAERVGRPIEHGSLLSVHKSGLVALRLYDGALKIIQWTDLKDSKDFKDLKCFSVRLEDIQVVDFTFMHTTGDEIKIAYIYSDSNGRHLKVCELGLIDKDIRTVAKHDNIESESLLIIPVPHPYGGVIIVGQETLLYYKDDLTYLSISPSLMRQGQFCCFASIDDNGQRFLLGDRFGNLCMIVLDLEENEHQVTNMKLELLGEISTPECLVYLDNGVIFVGSRFGDSQLIRLSTTPGAENSFITILESFINLAPIRDMTVIENDGQTQLITCSGCFKDGSLRVIRNGIGIEEAASVDLPGIKGIFALNIDSEFDNYLVVSFDDDTHILKIEGEELEDTDLLTLTTEASTLWAGKIGETKSVVQVTSAAVRLCAPGRDTKCWSPPESVIDLVAVNGKSGQIVVVCGPSIYYLKCLPDQHDFEQICSKVLDFEISCVDITSLDTEESTLVAVGFWTENSAALFSLPDLNEIIREKLAVDILPRSILITVMEDIAYLLLALGDGCLFYYTIDRETGALRDLKKASLGTQPPTLLRFESRGMTNVFACSDRPTVIFSSNNKLVFSNVNLKLLTHMCCLNSEKYRDCLVMSDGETMSIGMVDDIQKLHIRSVPLGESVKRIAYQKETNSLGILCERVETSSRTSISKMATVTSHSKPEIGLRAHVAAESGDGMIHSFVLLNANTFEPLHTHEFAPNEHAVSVISTSLGEDPRTYYIVGTAIIYNDETEVKSGRLIVFETSLEDHHRLRKVSEKEVKGCPFSMDVLGSKLIVALNSSVRLFEWPDSDKPELRLECSHFNHIAALQLKVKGDQVLVGDLMRSVCVLSYKSMECVFEESARDHRGMWMTAVEFIDAETVLGAESSFNIFTGEVDRCSAEDKPKLKEGGQYYIGEMVNVFRRGSLLASHIDSQLPVDKPILFGTSDGSIGLIVQIPSEYFKFLGEVETAIAKKTVNCIRVTHNVYRQFHAQRSVEKAFGFIDGDLVESVLEWPREKRMEAFKYIKVPGKESLDQEQTTEEIIKIIEDLSRIH